MDDLSHICTLLEDIKALLEEQKAERERREREASRLRDEAMRVLTENFGGSFPPGETTPTRMREVLRAPMAEMQKHMEEWAECEDYLVKLHERTNLLLEMILDRLLQVTETSVSRKAGE